MFEVLQPTLEFSKKFSIFTHLTLPRLLKIERDIEREKAKLERRRDELYAKQGRNSRFDDQNSRDKWIKEEIRKLDAQIRRNEVDLQREQDDVERIRQENSDRNNAISQCRAEVSKIRKILYRKLSLTDTVTRKIVRYKKIVALYATALSPT